MAAAAEGLGQASTVVLAFRLEPRRTVDLDNLVRPVLAGLRDAGVFVRGFAGLDTLVASKAFSENAGVTIWLDTPVDRPPTEQPALALTEVESDVLPTEGNLESKHAWRDAVASMWTVEPVTNDVWIDAVVRSGRSLEGLMKPIIDGLDPILGRDPRGRLEFVPNDHLVTWLRFRRDADSEAVLRVCVGCVAE